MLTQYLIGAILIVVIITIIFLLSKSNTVEVFSRDLTIPITVRVATNYTISMVLNELNKYRPNLGKIQIIVYHVSDRNFVNTDVIPAYDAPYQYKYLNKLLVVSNMPISILLLAPEIFMLSINGTFYTGTRILFYFNTATEKTITLDPTTDVLAYVFSDVPSLEGGQPNQIRVLGDKMRIYGPLSATFRLENNLVWTNLSECYSDVYAKYTTPFMKTITDAICIVKNVNPVDAAVYTWLSRPGIRFIGIIVQSLAHLITDLTDKLPNLEKTLKKMGFISAQYEFDFLFKCLVFTNTDRSIFPIFKPFGTSLVISVGNQEFRFYSKGDAIKESGTNLNGALVNTRIEPSTWDTTIHNINLETDTYILPKASFKSIENSSMFNDSITAASALTLIPA